MPAEETLWEGSPAIKMLALDLASTALFSLALSLVVYLGFQPALHFLAGLSQQAAEAVAAYRPGFRLAALAFVLVLIGRRVGGLIWRALALRGHRYRLSNQRLVIESGVLSKTLTEIDIRTVEEVSFHQSFAERLLGIGQISLVSSSPAPSAASLRRPGREVRLLGVLDPRAVREKIRDAAYAATGNQVFMRAT
ncbi:MAG TPA: PH domain-containing protein [Polyangia bacterium]